MIKLQNIDAILFDMIGTLLFKKKNYNPSNLVDNIDAIAGSVTDDVAFKREVLKKFNLSKKEFNTVIAKIVNKYEPFQKLWDLLPELKKHYKLAIVNNGTGLTFSQFDKKFNFKKNFDLFISSAREGLKKPDSKIFLITAKRLGVMPKRCLFMDDLEKNIEGAKLIGMQTIFWPERNKGFKKFIDTIGYSGNY